MWFKTYFSSAVVSLYELELMPSTDGFPLCRVQDEMD